MLTGRSPELPGPGVVRARRRPPTHSAGDVEEVLRHEHGQGREIGFLEVVPDAREPVLVDTVAEIIHCGTSRTVPTCPGRPCGRPAGPSKDHAVLRWGVMTRR